MKLEKQIYGAADCICPQAQMPIASCLVRAAASYGRCLDGPLRAATATCFLGWIWGCAYHDSYNAGRRESIRSHGKTQCAVDAYLLSSRRNRQPAAFRARGREQLL